MTFDQIDPLIVSGHLKHLNQLRQSNALSNADAIDATTPSFNTSHKPTSILPRLETGQSILQSLPIQLPWPAVWATLTTGVNPGVHGVFDRVESPLKDRSQPPVTSQSVMAQRCWQVSPDDPHRSIIINVPGTYPPDPLNGCMICGMGTPNELSNYTWPANLKIRLKAYCGHYVPDTDFPALHHSPTDPQTLLDTLHETMQRRHEAIRHLMDTETWSTLLLVETGLGQILRWFGQSVTPRVRQEMDYIDSILGDIAQRCPPDADLRLVMEPTAATTTDTGKWDLKPPDFDVTDWLIREKLLVTRRRPWRKPHVDWSQTRAFCGRGALPGIYINESTDENPQGIVATTETDALARDIKHRLLSVRHPQSGLPIMDGVWLREELFHGPETKFAPHLLFRVASSIICR